MKQKPNYERLSAGNGTTRAGDSFEKSKNRNMKYTTGPRSSAGAAHKQRQQRYDEESAWHTQNNEQAPRVHFIFKVTLSQQEERNATTSSAERRVRATHSREAKPKRASLQTSSNSEIEVIHAPVKESTFHYHRIPSYTQPTAKWRCLSTYHPISSTGIYD